MKVFSLVPPMATLTLGFTLVFAGSTALAQMDDDASDNAVWTNDEGVPWMSDEGECWRNPNEPSDEMMEACGDVIAQEEPEPEPEPEAAEPEMEMRTQELELDARTLFGFDEATLSQDGREMIDEALAESSDDDWELTAVEIRGHTDRIGPSDYNQQLSERRAGAVGDYLRDHADMRGVDLDVSGAGESDPIVECEGERGDAAIECLQPNRRVQMDMHLERTVRVEVSD